MNKISLLLLTVLLTAFSAKAKSVVAPVGVDSLIYTHQGNELVVEMRLNLKPTDVASSRAQIITPLVVTMAGDTIALPSVGVYGRQRYINYLRSNKSASPEPGVTAFRASERPDTYPYEYSLPYSEKLNGSTLVIRRSLYGCANCLLDEKSDVLRQNFEFAPAKVQQKYSDAFYEDTITYTVEGAAYLDFLTGKTDINPSYRRNPEELMRIQESIDTVLNDKDLKITEVWLKGFASPEGSYANNRQLAIGRTEALRRHIRQLYNFNDNIIKTESEPEDWAGLRTYVAKSNIGHREEILDIIDSGVAPDAKEALIKGKFPAEYQFMYDNFYPALRHTEYRVTYQVRHFDDVDEIREVMRTRPNRLTLREFYILGNATLPGSDEFNEVYETAARMYPDDPVANTNAANAALQRGDLSSAEQYLAKAGDSKDAQYARASLAFARGDYDEAERLLQSLTNMPAARQLLDEIYNARAARESKKPHDFLLE